MRNLFNNKNYRLLNINVFILCFDIIYNVHVVRSTFILRGLITKVPYS